MTKETGGPAFPGKQKALLIPAALAHAAEAIEVETNGMALRDWFAGMALQGLVSYCGSEGFDRGPQDMADRLYELADAMLKARGE